MRGVEEGKEVVKNASVGGGGAPLVLQTSAVQQSSAEGGAVLCAIQCGHHLPPVATEHLGTGSESFKFT